MPATDLLKLHALMVEGKKGFTATCLETGSVGMGASEEIAENNLCNEIEELVDPAIETGDFTKIFSSQAPAKIWAKFCETFRALTGTAITTDAYQKSLVLNCKSEDSPVAENVHLVRADS